MKIFSIFNEKWRTVPKFIDPVLAKTSPKRSFSIIGNERFGLVFAKTGSVNSGTGTFFSFSLDKTLSFIAARDNKDDIRNEKAKTTL